MSLLKNALLLVFCILGTVGCGSGHVTQNEPSDESTAKAYAEYQAAMKAEKDRHMKSN